ncbi:hypothetical protein [Prochlorococcus sp. MIT 1341]|uniref:hypothetical protein n=1 Tax=Prochlorococcus sp. MIT 1341 TaxID=3096221 RepID=UPI002A75D1FD|nr:hypothetical protein [Prochlorococcus sp. MIT 1341]
MNQLPDRTVILALIGTLILVFSLIFSTRPSSNQIEPTIQWREMPELSSEIEQIRL